MPEPMYRLIADDLRGRIESGAFAPGSQLPSELELGEEYGERYGQNGRPVSRNAIREALRILVTRGLVEPRPGQGTFVSRRVRPFLSKLKADPQAGGVEDTIYRSEVERQGREPDETRPRVEVQVASPLVARQLQLGEDAEVISRHQERKIDGTPFSLQTTFYSIELLDRGEAASRLLAATNVEGGMVNYLKEHLGIVQVGWRDTIIARPPTPNERDFFGLSEKVLVAIVEFRRTSYDRDGHPIRFTVTVYPADRNQFEMEAGDVPTDAALRKEPPSAGSPYALFPVILAGSSLAVGRVNIQHTGERRHHV
jgi:GntR family transcriptional regulator